MSAGPSVRPLGDGALVVTFGAELSEAVNDRVMALAASLRKDPLSAYVRDVVPAIASLVIHVDPSREEIERLIERLEQRAQAISGESGRLSSHGATHEIHVQYGGEGGPDLDDVAAFAGCSPAEVVARHAAQIYRVYMLGFLPGFAYLGEVDASIAAPRRSSPRQHVPAGSVGIAGRQTGIYPQDSPGGWQIIGRTDSRMFDTVTGQSLLSPGDRVRFVAKRERNGVGGESAGGMKRARRGGGPPPEIK